MQTEIDFKSNIRNSSSFESYAASYWYRSWKRLKSNKKILFGLSVLGLLLLLSCIVPLLSPYSYYETHLPLKNLPPSKNFWMGTDELGRDLFTRVWWGTRISLFVGITAAFIDLIIGVIYGSLAGMLGNKIDELMMRITDIIYSIPYLLIVILLTVIIGSGLLTIMIALTLTGWIPMARTVRGQIIQLKHMDYAFAACALGASRLRILFRHLLPNALGPIIATMTFTIPSAIFAEAFLSFLGLGIQAPIASLGTMTNNGLSALCYFPWRLFFPAFFISLTILCCNLIGDGMRDAFDPRLQQ